MGIYNLLFTTLIKAGINFYSTLPCSYNVEFIQKLEETINQSNYLRNIKKELPSNIHHVPLVREESGVALSAGAYIGGAKTAMLFQNQGLGNMITQLLALNSQQEGSYKIPNIYIISHRGLEGEKIAAQKPLGKKTGNILDLTDIKYTFIQSPSDLDKIEELLLEYDKGNSIAFLVAPEYEQGPLRLDAKLSINRKLQGATFPSINKKATMSRYKAISIIMNLVENEYIISNIGHPSRELHQIKDRGRNFYLTSSLGQSYMLALGFALSLGNNSEKILCFEGDGAILMNSASLSLIPDQNPTNLIIIVLDNGVYGSTGNVPTYALNKLNLGAIAHVYGFPESKIRIISEKKTLRDEVEFALTHDGPFFFHVLINDFYKPVPIIPFSAEEIKRRFMSNR
ncbi:MAG: putative Sulfopyruvate decarboxylase [Promethearchaeota archaeon]|nr:MAG: putative Sulfopyruvate decarboxylase [Candidatus Lokiarchaeota archaeon]